jgi:transmembrane sensor
MTKKQEHIDQELSKESSKMISETHIAWDKSREQIWAELENKLEMSQTPEPKVVFMPWMKIALAASIIVLLGIPIVMQFYVRTLVIPAGKHSSITLPDNSIVKLNAQSILSYKPLLYKFSRQVKFEGEAFFDVQPGKKFEVVSTRGTTLVLGTTFNIYSRDEDYQVMCVSGKVKVTERSNNKEIILGPGQKALLTAESIFNIQSEVNEELVLSWIDNKLNFTSVPLPKVFEEIGRQYGVFIEIPKDIDNIYTGTFKKTSSLENTLILVCKPFDLRFTRKSSDEYIISRNN